MRPAGACRSLCLALAATLFSGAADLATAKAVPDSAAAGWAEVDITPPLGIGLGGRAGPGTVAKEVLDPLYAQVLLLKDGKGVGFVLVSFDLIGLPHDLSDRLRTRIVQELAVDWNLVVLNWSHTHSGPYTLRSLMAGVGPAPSAEMDYFKSLEEKITTAARAAEEAMKPVQVEVFEGRSRLGINRRGKNGQGARAMLPDPEGPFDDKVWVMKLTPDGAQAPAVVFSYACHPVIVYGFALGAISADFPGVARKEVREQLGPGTHAQFVQGFAGNIRPRVVADLETRRFRASEPSDLQQAGKELAGAVMVAMGRPGQKLRLKIAGSADRPFLPRAEPPPRALYEKMHETALTNTNTYRLGVSEYWLKRYDTGKGFARGDAWSLGLIRLADNQWIVHSGGEPCVEWRGKISEWLNSLTIVTWGYSQEAKSYLPTERLLGEGGYEVLESNEARESTPAPFATGIEKAVRESLRRQLAFLKGSG